MAQIQIQAIDKLFTVTRQVAPGAKFALDDCLIFLIRSFIFFPENAKTATCVIITLRICADAQHSERGIVIVHVRVYVFCLLKEFSKSSLLFTILGTLVYVESELSVFCLVTFCCGSARCYSELLMMRQT